MKSKMKKKGKAQVHKNKEHRARHLKYKVTNHIHLRQLLKKKKKKKNETFFSLTNFYNVKLIKL